MKDQISVSYMRTVNLGNYESAKIQAGIVQEISDKDKRGYEKIFDNLFEECENFVLKRCEIEAGA